LNRRETLVELARTLHDARTTDTTETGAGGHSNGNDSRLLQLSNLYHDGSYASLELALEHMRRYGKQHAVQGWSLQTLRWHFVARYIDCDRKRYAARSRGRHLEILHDHQWQPANSEGRQAAGAPTSDAHGQRVLMVETWHPDTRADRVELALDWLEANTPKCRCRDAPPHRLHLPNDWQHDRKRESVAA
jgi:hypothetical protein